MVILEDQTPIEKKKKSLLEKIQDLKNGFNVFLRKKLGIPIPEDDPFTIQKWPGAGGGFNYYIKDGMTQYITKNPSYSSVTSLLVDDENHKYLYIGMVGKTGNYLGVIQTNKPLEEIVRSQEGNDAFAKMLSEEFSKEQKRKYYESKNIVVDESKSFSIFAPPFGLGVLIDTGKGYEIDDKLTEDILDTLYIGEMEQKEAQKRIKDKNVLRRVGNITIPNTYIERDLHRRGAYKGVNNDSLEYNYTDVDLIGNTENEYFYIGNLTTGEIEKGKSGERVLAIFDQIKRYNNVIISLPKPIDTLITEHHLKVEDAFSHLFTDNGLVSMEGVNQDFLYAGKVVSMGENHVYDFSRDKIISEEGLKMIQGYLKEKEKAKESKRGKIVTLEFKRKNVGNDKKDENEEGRGLDN